MLGGEYSTAVSLLLGMSLADRTGTTASLKIIEGLCFESEFDTEALLRVLAKTVPDQESRNYRGVLAESRNPGAGADDD